MVGDAPPAPDLPLLLGPPAAQSPRRAFARVPREAAARFVALTSNPSISLAIRPLTRRRRGT
jgi:hypothetical protein